MVNPRSPLMKRESVAWLILVSAAIRYLDTPELSIARRNWSLNDCRFLAMLGF
jgi:hypothetical protein